MIARESVFCEMFVLQNMSHVWLHYSELQPFLETLMMIRMCNSACVKFLEKELHFKLLQMQLFFKKLDLRRD